ncbi:MAG: hypothetical protein R8G66_08690 [Cytophagales bacterium]|nr:hypothetical protein [Cytophagales bacterium]
MNEPSLSFGPQKTLVIIPALFWGAFLILFFAANEFVWGWGFCLGSGVLALLAFMAQYRIYRFDASTMNITGPLSTKSISLADIQTHNRRTLTRRGIHYYTWTLEFRNGKKLNIMSDYMKDPQGFRKAFELWIKQKD